MKIAEKLAKSRWEAEEANRQKKEKAEKDKECSARENLPSVVKKDFEEIVKELEKHFLANSYEVYIRTTDFVKKDFHEEKVNNIMQCLKDEGFRVSKNDSTYLSAVPPTGDDDWGREEQFCTKIEIHW